MTILRSDYMVALNDLIVACREAAMQHRTAAEACGKAALRSAFETLSRDRDAAADELAHRVADQGDIPNAPAEEKELLQSAISRVKAALSEDEVAALVEDSESKEVAVAEAVDAVLQHADDAEQRSWLEQLRDDTKSRIATLRRQAQDS